MTMTDEAQVAAVSGDAHWQAKMEKLRNRQLPERTLDFYDNVLRQDRDRTQIEKIAADADEDKTDEEKAEAAAAFEAAEAAYNESIVSIPLRALPRPAYEALLNTHEPTEEQEREGEAYNVDTFAPALISACSVDGMTVEMAVEMIGQKNDKGEYEGGILNHGESSVLFRTCTQLNEMVHIDVGKGSRPTLG